jgi:hypothetical protein
LRLLVFHNRFHLQEMGILLTRIPAYVTLFVIIIVSFSVILWRKQVVLGHVGFAIQLF